MPLVTLDTITTEQLNAILEVRGGRNLDYDTWRELHLLGLVSVNMSADDNAPVMDVLTDEALEILGELR